MAPLIVSIVTRLGRRRHYYQQHGAGIRLSPQPGKPAAARRRRARSSGRLKSCPYATASDAAPATIDYRDAVLGFLLNSDLPSYSSGGGDDGDGDDGDGPSRLISKNK